MTWSGLSSDVHRSVMDNGLRVLVKEVYPTSVVSLALWVGVGGLHESEDQAGISHFLEHMLFKGSAARPAGALAREVQALGGYVNAFTSFETTCFWFIVPSRHFLRVLDIASEALAHPLLEEAEARREAQVILDEMRMHQDRPGSFCLEKLLELAFPHHPYGRPILGRPAVLRSLGSRDLRQFHRQAYVPANLAVVAVGDVQVSQVLGAVEAGLGRLWPGGAKPARPQPEEPQEGMRRLELLGDLSSAHLQVLFPLPSLFEPEALACDLVASLLGDGRSSRLYRRLRERRGLVTRVGSSAFLEREPGFLVVDCTLPPENLEAVEAEVFEELEALGRVGPDPHEMQKARNRAEAAFVFGQETVEGVGRVLGRYEMLGDHTLAESYLPRLAAITPDQVVQASRRYLAPHRCSVVRYRPASAGRRS